jgi:hypothetical protein
MLQPFVFFNHKHDSVLWSSISTSIGTSTSIGADIVANGSSTRIFHFTSHLTHRAPGELAGRGGAGQVCRLGRSAAARARRAPDGARVDHRRARRRRTGRAAGARGSIRIMFDARVKIFASHVADFFGGIFFFCKIFFRLLSDFFRQNIFCGLRFAVAAAQVFPFTSESKRMGIIVRDHATRRITFYLKGAESIMKQRMKQARSSKNISTRNYLLHFSIPQIFCKSAISSDFLLDFSQIFSN